MNVNFLSDERYVKANSSENNAYNLSNMLNKLNCHDNFIPVNTHLEPNSAAEDYGKKSMLSHLLKLVWWV